MAHPGMTGMVIIPGLLVMMACIRNTTEAISQCIRQDMESTHTKGHGSHHQDAIKFISHILKFKEGMSVTAEQEQKLRALKTTYKKDRIKTKAEVELASIDLHEVLKNEKARLSDIEAEFNKLHALKTKLYMASIKAKRDAKAVLSEEQRARMDKIHERIKSHGGNMEHSGDYSKYKKSKDHGTNGPMK